MKAIIRQQQNVLTNVEQQDENVSLQNSARYDSNSRREKHFF